MSKFKLSSELLLSKVIQIHQEDNNNQVMMSEITQNIEELKKSRQHESLETLISSIRNDLYSKYIYKANVNEKDVKLKITTSEITKALENFCDLAVLRTSNHLSTLYIGNPQTKLMTSSVEFVKMILSGLSSHVISQNGNRRELRFEIVIDDIDIMTKKVITKLKTNPYIRDFVQLPNHYVVTLNKLVINLKTNEIFDLDSFILKYDITSNCYFNFINYKSLDKETRQKSLVNRQIIERVMKDWSGNDKEKEYLLWQVMYAVLQNDNHDKFIVIKGPGGNGKSTYMMLLSKVAGTNHVVHANIHQFGDPNSINKIDLSTRLIIGDDAATNHKISDIATSNIKSIVTSNPISVPMKYQDNVVIKTHALYIQGTNTDLSFYENNPALKSRMIVITWSDIDFRSIRSELTFDLDSLMKDQSFIDEWVMMCLEKVDYFKEFSIPESVKNETNEMIESNDTIKQFLDEYWFKINRFDTIPIKVLYLSYVKWSKEFNPKGGLMKLPTFAKEINSKSNDYRFEKIDSSRKKIFKKYDPIIECILLALNLNDYDVDLSRQTFIKNQHTISDEEVEDFIQQDHPISNDLSSEEYQLLLLAVYQFNRTDLQSIYQLT